MARGAASLLRVAAVVVVVVAVIVVAAATGAVAAAARDECPVLDAPSARQYVSNVDFLLSQRRTAAAIDCLERALRLEPESVTALFQLAHVQLSVVEPRDYDAGLRHLRRAIDVDERAELVQMYAQASALAGRGDDALRAYRRAVQLAPDNYEAWNHFGIVAYQQHALDEAERAYSGALAAIERVHVDVAATPAALATYYFDLATIFEQRGALLDAAATVLRAVERFAAHADVQSRYAARLLTLFARLGRSADEARALLVRAEQLAGARRAAELGSTEQAMALARGCGPPIAYAECAERYSAVLARDPEHVEAHFEFGKLAVAQGEHAAALEHYAAARRFDRGANPMIAYAYGVLLRTQQRQEEAVVEFRAAFTARPDEGLFRSDYLHTLKNLCEWDELERHLPALLAELERGDALPHIHPYSALMYGCSNDVIWRQAQLFGARAAGGAHVRRRASFDYAPLPPRDAPAAQRAAARERPLRIGFVSSNFINHAQGAQMSNFFGFVDRTAFDVVLYSLRRPATPNAVEQFDEIAAQVTRVVDLVGERDPAARVAADRCDVLVDMVGLIDDARTELFAERPAPVQVHFLGYPGTIGVPGVADYYVGDAISTPPATLQRYFTERLILMPHTYQVTEHRAKFPLADWLSLPPPAAEHVSDVPLGGGGGGGGDGGDPSSTTTKPFVFANFNNNIKIDPATFATWMRVLHRVPNSVLWLLGLPSYAAPRLRAAAQRAGIDPVRRVAFAPHTTKLLHLRRVAHYADLLLDTPFYNAHTSAGDALWAGVPLLTISNETMASRVAQSMIAACALPTAPFVVHTRDEYEERAVQLAADRDGELARLRAMIVARREHAPLFDTRRYVADFELAMRTVWRRYVDGGAPRSFALDDQRRVEWLDDDDDDDDEQTRRDEL